MREWCKHKQLSLVPHKPYASQGISHVFAYLQVLSLRIISFWAFSLLPLATNNRWYLAYFCLLGFINTIMFLFIRFFSFSLPFLEFLPVSSESPHLIVGTWCPSPLLQGSTPGAPPPQLPPAVSAMGLKDYTTWAATFSDYLHTSGLEKYGQTMHYGVSKDKKKLISIKFQEG